MRKIIVSLMLFDLNPKLCEAWERYFQCYHEVMVSNTQYECLSSGPDCVVASGNSFGMMDGGFDGVLIAKYGQGLMFDVQAAIRSRYAGMQPVGTCVMVNTGPPDYMHIAYAPTMRVPMDISGSDNVYMAMSAALVEAARHGNISILAIPGLGTCTGRIPVEEAARQMELAYRHYLAGIPFPMTWDYALTRNAEIANEGR